MAEDSGDKKEEVLNAPPSQDDIEKAECLKADANKFFKDEKYQQAVDLYTQVKQHSLYRNIILWMIYVIVVAAFQGWYPRLYFVLSSKDSKYGDIQRLLCNFFLV